MRSVDFTDLEFLKDYCNKNIKKIATKSINDHLITNIEVRYVNYDSEFGYTTIGQFFFISDSMHLITKESRYRKEHDDEIFDMFDELEPLREKGVYIVKVFFAGFYTGFVDDNGRKVFTGDVVETRVIANPTIPSTGGRHRAIQEGVNLNDPKSRITITAGVGVVFNEPSVILDNHHIPLKWAIILRVIGNVFYELSSSMEEVDMKSRCGALAQMRPNDREKIIFLTTYAPYFGKLDWKRAALRELGIEEN